MANSKLFKIILTLVLIACTCQQTTYFTASVNPTVVSRVNFFLNNLATEVQTYNWVFCNKPKLYNTVKNAVAWLKLIRESLPGGNLVDGSGNYVEGKDNIVIGNKNTLKGVNSWVFVSNYKNKGTAIEDSILAIGNYKIDLTKIESINRTPASAISIMDKDGYNNLCTKNIATAYFFTS